MGAWRYRWTAGRWPSSAATSAWRRRDSGIGRQQWTSSRSTDASRSSREGAGASGPEIARTFARAGAAVSVTSRTADDVESVAKQIEADGGTSACLSHRPRRPRQPTRTGRADRRRTGWPGHRGKQRRRRLRVVARSSTRPSSNWRRRSTSPSRPRSGSASLPSRTYLSARTRRSSTSVRSRSARRYAVTCSYEASKAAVTQLTKSMAADLGPRIRVNGIHPGAIETAFIREFLDNKPAEFRQAMINRTRPAPQRNPSRYRQRCRLPGLCGGRVGYRHHAGGQRRAGR